MKLASIRGWVGYLVLILGVAMVRAQQPGTLDATFEAAGSSGGRFFTPGGGNRVVVSGNFLTLGTPVNGRRAVARLLETGAVDVGFQCPLDPFSVTGHEVRSDGRILVYGSLTAAAGHPTKGVALLREDGGVDTAFRVNLAGSEPAVAVVPVPGAGCFVAYQNGEILRLGPDGAVDPGFVVTPALPRMPAGIAVQPSGKVVVIQNHRVFRLLANGTRDPDYTEVTFIGVNTDPARYAMAADGSLFVSATTAQFNSTELRTLVKLLPEGGADPGFRYAGDGTTAGARTPTHLRLDRSGRLLVTGLSFTPAFQRVLPDGAVDTGFAAFTSPTGFGQDEQGRVLFSGTYLQTSPSFFFKTGILRLNNDDAPPVVKEPRIRTAPVPLVVRSGEMAGLSVVAAGEPPLTYRWQRDGAEVDGATTDVLALSPVRQVDGGSYRVIVGNAHGSVTSGPVALTVLTEPWIRTPPQGFTAKEGEAGALSAEVLGEPPLVFRWLHEGQEVAGGASARLELGSLTTAAGGWYVLEVSGPGGSTTSAPVRVTVLASRPEWFVHTNVTTPSILTNTLNPVRPDSALRVRADRDRGVVVLYPNALERWDDAGRRQWTIRYEEADFGRLEVLALDREGNAYVGGRIHFTARLGDMAMTNASNVTGPNGHVQAFIAKVDVDGRGLWYRLYEAAGPSLRELAVDEDGGVVFAGGNGGRNGLSRLGNLAASESEYAAAVVGKLQPDGTPVFFRSFPQFTVNKSTCEASAVTADPTGIYVAGLISFSIQFGNHTLQNVGASPGNWIGKLNTNGEPQWIRAAGGQPSQGAPLAAGGGRRWFLLPRDRVLQSWSPEGAIVTNLTAVSGFQGDSALVTQLGVATNGSPMLVGFVKGNLTVAGTAVSPGAGRPALWFGQWSPDGAPVRGRLLATTTNANVNVGLDNVLLAAHAATATGDLIVAGQYVSAMRWLGGVYTSPAGSHRPDGYPAGAFLAKVRQPAMAPEITQQPIAAYEMGTGDTVRIGIRAIGPEPLSYQWRKDGSGIEGAVTNSLELANVTVADAGVYDVVVTNAYGIAVSEAARITVRPPFRIQTQPSTQLVLGPGVRLSGGQIDPALMQGGAIANKLLRFGFTESSSPRFTVPGVFAIQFTGVATAGNYAVQAGGVLPVRQGTYAVPFALPDLLNVRLVRLDGTNFATLGLKPGGFFDLHYDIAEADGCCGAGTFTIEGGDAQARFSVATTSFVPEGNYQWQRNGQDLPGRTAATLVLTNVTEADQGEYRVLIRYRGHEETSVAVALRVVTGAVVEPPVLDPGVFQVGGGGMTVPSWPAGFVLQRTVQLSPATWETIATAPPVFIPFSEPGAFFRLVSGP